MTQIDVMAPYVVWSPRAHNYFCWDSAREIWMSLAPGRTIWEHAADDEVEGLLTDIRENIIE
jgi:hypothetical protein